jgi:hypothetical protein
MDQHKDFRQALWQSVRPDLLASYRDAIIILNLLAIIAVIQVGFLGLAVIHVDKDLIEVLGFLHKWATVIAFGLFLYTIVVRSFVVAIGAHKKADGI